MFNSPFLMIDPLTLRHISEKMNITDKIVLNDELLKNNDYMSQILQKSGTRALLSIHGPMVYSPSIIDRVLFGATSTQDLMVAVDDIMKDEDIKSVVIKVNSGGGEAHKVNVLADMIHALSKQKSCATLNTGVMASAAYYAGSQTGKVFVDDKYNMTGSIGTVNILHDTSGMAKKAGVKVIPVATGPLKGLPADGVELSDEVIQYVQSIVDDIQEGFSNAVMRVRPHADMSNGSEARTGKAFLFDKAYELGLIDGMKSLDAIFSMLEAGNKFKKMRNYL